MKTVLITGINGYIAQHLAQALTNQVNVIHGSVRRLETQQHNQSNHRLFATGDFSNHINWTDALHNVDTVYHLAGSVHTAYEPAMYNKTIVHATRNLVKQAIEQGVRHFVYVSSTAVYGKEHHPSRLSEMDTPQPNNPYGEAKLAAENEVISLCDQSSMTYTIVRPPIVYGPSAPGNVERLQKLIRKIPILPLASATEKRSMVSIDNLVNFLIMCGTKVNAQDEIFNITDDDDHSTSDLCRVFALEMNKRILLLPFPKSIIKLLLSMIGQRTMYDKLFGQLQFSMDHAKERLY